MQEIIVEIDLGGAARIEVKGVKGKACKDVTKALEAAIGGVKSTENTKEMHETERATTRNRA